jgi:glycerol-3-phosphate O-acyltransferase/dihydroxyacetone phosphate acyltransferase
MSQNLRTFEACRQLLRQGRCIALFPEGLSHNSTKLMPIKTGAARIALGAISVEANADESEAFDLKIVPVGLYYTSKTSFRSEALIRFGEGMTVEPVALDEQGEPPREAVKELSKRIEMALREVTLNVESDEALEEVSKTEQLFSSIYESINMRQTLSEEFDLRRRFASELRASRAGDELRGRILSYETELATLGITPENLSLITHSRWYVFRHFLLKSMLLLMLLPLALIGAALHFPAYFFSNALAQAYREHGVDDIVSTVKILAAIALMPLTWLAVTLLAFIFWGWRISLLTLPSVIVCGYVAMRFVEEAVDMTGWHKAVLALLRRRRLFLRLLLERRRLHNAIRKMGV